MTSDDFLWIVRMAKHKREVGDRIGAIRNANAEAVYFFGYGTYQGEEVPPEDVRGPFGCLGLYGAKNPKLLLDDGTVVWGCESWWGDEDGCRANMGNRHIEIVRPTRTPPTDEERAEALEIMGAAKAEAAAGDVNDG